MTKTTKKQKNKMPLGIKKTILFFLLIILFMGVLFNLPVELVYSHKIGAKANVLLWPIKQLSELLVYKGFGISETDRWGSVLEFALTEIPYILLVLLIFGYLFNFARGFSSDLEMARWIERQSGIKGAIVGVVIGAISPFCSCSTIPITTSMVKSGINFKTLTAFLITSPMINEAGLAIMFSIWGYKISLIYLAFGLSIGFMGAYLFSFLKLEDQLKISPEMKTETEMMEYKPTIGIIHKKAWKNSFDNFKKFWWILVIAMIVGALMHGWLPKAWIQQHLAQKWWTPLVLVPLGMAMYLNITATIPIADTFVKSGIGLGPSLGFMMGVNTVSIPEIIILSKLFKKKFMFIFVSYLFIAILAFSYIIFLIPYAALLA